MTCFKRSIPVLVAALLAAGHAVANPTVPTVTHGSATFQTSGNVLTVRNTPGAIINWQSFSVGNGDVTRFLQHSASSAILNRVTGGNPSTILGQLHSNGKVFVANPNGVVFGVGSQVSATSFTATTGHIANESFLAGTATPTGGVTMTVVGSFGGYASLGATNATLDGVRTGASFSITTPGTVTIEGGGITVDGSIVITTGSNLNLGGVVATTNGGAISIGGGGVTVTTPGGNDSGETVTVIPGTNTTIAVAGGSTASAPPALAVTRSVSAPGTNVSAVAGRHVAPISARPALFVLEKREPLF